MDIKGYDCKSGEELLYFEFYSEGPKGKIKKVIEFTPRNSGGKTYFNLSFGDWNESTACLDDQSISNNNDREKILATIASVVLKFTTHFPDMWVYAQGSTPARTRLYQMGIASRWKEIEPLLHVFGLSNEKWEVFRPSTRYDAFLVLKKINS